MKSIDYLQLSLTSIIRDRKKKYMICIFSICTLLIVFALSFRSNFLSYIDDSITKNIGFRSLIVDADHESEDYGLNTLREITNVVDVYSSRYSFVSVKSNFANDNLDGNISFWYGGVNSLPNRIIGRTFDENETGMAICPMKFYPSDSVYNLEMNPDYIIDGNDLLNSFFEITYYSRTFDGYKASIVDTFTKKFEIVGLYDNSEVMTMNNDCFVSPKDIIEIIETQSALGIQGVYGWRVVVNDLKNVDQVKDKIGTAGFENVLLINSIDSNLFNTIVISTNIIVGFITATVIAISLSYNKKKIQNEMHTVGLLKTFGYTNSQIVKKYLLIFSFTNLLSLFIGFLFMFIIFVILKNTLLAFLAPMGIILTISIYDIIFSLVLIVVLPVLASSYFIIKAAKTKLPILIGSDI